MPGDPGPARGEPPIMIASEGLRLRLAADALAAAGVIVSARLTNDKVDAGDLGAAAAPIGCRRRRSRIRRARRDRGTPGRRDQPAQPARRGHPPGRESRQVGCYPSFATHNDQLIEEIIAAARQQGWAIEDFKFEMLYGGSARHAACTRAARATESRSTSRSARIGFPIPSAVSARAPATCDSPSGPSPAPAPEPSSRADAVITAPVPVASSCHIAGGCMARLCGAAWRMRPRIDAA
jgi:hypothetical protein